MQKDTYGTVLNFHFGIGVRPKGPQMGDLKNGQAQK